MNTAAAATVPSSRPRLDSKPSPVTGFVFLSLLVIGLAYTAWSLVADISATGERATTWLPFFLLGIALLIALEVEITDRIFADGFDPAL